MVKTLLSVAVVAHCLALAISFTSAVEPSSTQAMVENQLSTYLKAFHFSTSEAPVYLAAGNTSEQPLRLQFTKRDPRKELDLLSANRDDPRWETIEPNGIGGAMGQDFYARWMTGAAILAETDSPGPVAELLLPKISDDESILAVRVIRLPTELSTTLQDQAPPVFTAIVSRANDQLALIQATERRLSTIGKSESGQ